MIKSLFTITSEFQIFNFIIGLCFIGLIVWLIAKYYPEIEKSIQEKLLSSFNRSSEDSSNQPLYKIFYKFNHSSTEAWVNWVLSQDESTKELAFQKLTKYLEEPPEELGSTTCEAVKAVITFNDSNSLDTIIELLGNSRRKWGIYKSIESFYEQAAFGLVELDEKIAIDFLKAEFNQIKSKANTEKLQVYIIKALASSESISLEETFWTKLLLDKSVSTSVKYEIIKLVEAIEDNFCINVLSQVLQKYIDLDESQFNISDNDILERIFHKIKRLSFDDKVWSTIMAACDKIHLKDLFTKLTLDLIQDTSYDLNQEQLQDLLDKEGILKTRFKDALAKRFKLSQSERSLVTLELSNEELEFESKTLNIEDSRDPDMRIEHLKEIYDIFERTFLNQSNEGEIPILCGDDQAGKIYLLRKIAAKNKRKFIYIDIAKIYHSPAMLNELGATINNNKPCVVYLDNLDQLLNCQLEREDRNKIKELNSTLDQARSMAKVDIVAVLPHSISSLYSNFPDIQQCLDSGVRGKYKAITNLNNPDINERRKIFNQYLSKVDESKVSDSFISNEFTNNCEGFSNIEYSNYLGQYFEYSLLIYGELIPIEEFSGTLGHNRSTINI